MNTSRQVNHEAVATISCVRTGTTCTNLGVRITASRAEDIYEPQNLQICNLWERTMKIIDITYLVGAVHAAAHMGVDSLIVEPTGLRGIDAGRNVVFKQEGQLPFGNIGLKNVKSLSTQLKLIAGSGEINAKFDIQYYQIQDVDKQANLLNKFKLPFDIAEFKDKEKARVQLLSVINEKLKSTHEYKESLSAEYKKIKDKEIKYMKEKGSARVVQIKNNIKKLDKEKEALSKKVEETKGESNEHLISEIGEKIKALKKEHEKIIAKYENEKQILDNKIKKIRRERCQLDIHRSEVEQLKNFTSLITFVSGNNIFSKHCVNPKDIYIPKTLIDTQKYLIDIEKDHVVTLKKACQTMKERIFNLYATEAGVFINVRGNYKDNLNIKIGETDGNIIFSHKYLTLPFIKLMDKDKSFTIGEAGLLKVTLNCFDFQLLPQ